ncbi:MAG: beta-ketoacyl synthase N-terminal-like domain-containing protein [Deltaproteobacteria bacterium]|nr:beta-ketoacyl synthase N-terminal-like domain-containing protein [Deltaproteobacteria bacterium]
MWITDAAIVTALGDTIEETWHHLLHFHTAIRPVDRFGVDGYRSDVAALVPGLKPDETGSRLPDLLKRLSRSMGSVPQDAWLITATTKGGIDMLGALEHKPSFSIRDMLPSVLDRIAADAFGLEKRGSTISAACASSAIAVSHACALIHTEMTDVVLVCCADLVTEFVFSGFSALGALSPTPCKPFDRDRNGLSLGEGAAALVLMDAERARTEGKRCLGQVLGWGGGSDAYHVTTPAPNATGLIEAIGQAFVRAQMTPDAVFAVCAHGTGTVSNDAMELNAYTHFFSDAWPPVYSIKGAVGHTLGAAGGIEVALGLKTLSRQTAPPTVGLSHPVETALGRVTTQPAALKGDILLTCNSGFGGINTAILLKRGI